jgi:AbrB family looped-hinge helix DNA binding protein
MLNQELYGTASVGEKGQIVIPVSARNALNIQVGDKLLVFSGPGKHGLMVVKPGIISKMAKKLSENLNEMQKLADTLETEGD